MIYRNGNNKLVFIAVIALCFIAFFVNSLTAATTQSVITVSAGKSAFCRLQNGISSSKNGESKLVIELDLSEFGDKVQMAYFHPIRNSWENFSGGSPNCIKPITIAYMENGSVYKQLELSPPYYLYFNITDEINRVLQQNGDKILMLQVDSFPGFSFDKSWFQITFNGSENITIPEIENIKAEHRNGQTFITWKEIESLIAVNTPLISDYKLAQENIKKREEAEKEPYILRYNIYRSETPISQLMDFNDIERVGVVKPLSGYNYRKYGMDWSYKTDKPIEMFVVDGSGKPLPDNYGVFVYTPQKIGEMWFTVVPCINGNENWSNIKSIGPVNEALSDIIYPVLQSEENGELLYGKGTIRHYVRWTAPPLGNLPSEPYNWVVAIPENPVWPAPLEIGLHSWGATPWGGYGWWYNWKQGTVLMATNDYPPQTWWYGYHEAYNTYKSWKDGIVHNYTEKRVLNMLEWIKKELQIDEKRVFVAGTSMGGSGATAMAARHSDIFSYGISWVGVHDYGNSPTFTNGFYNFLGDPQFGFKNSDGELVWNLLDLPWYVDNYHDKEPSFITFANGKNDGGIGWSQAVDFVNALFKSKRPFIFVWGQAGHGQRADHSAVACVGGCTDTPELDIRLDQSLPAFARCSLDDNPGNGNPEDGDSEGQINRYLRWDTSGIVDKESDYQIKLYLHSTAPEDSCTVDMTPRRLQNFSVESGESVLWENYDSNGKLIQQGEVAADSHGLITIESLIVSKNKNNVYIKKKLSADSPLPGELEKAYKKGFETGLKDTLTKNGCSQFNIDDYSVTMPCVKAGDRTYSAQFETFFNDKVWIGLKDIEDK